MQIPFDDALVERTRALLDDLRDVAESPTPPPPLVDSPKCPRCSLVGICLPDETNTLSDRSTAPAAFMPATTSPSRSTSPSKAPR